MNFATRIYGIRMPFVGSGVQSVHRCVCGGGMWSVCLLVLWMVAHVANPTSISKIEECLDLKFKACDTFLEKVKNAAGTSDCMLNETAAVCSVLVKKEATWQDANKTCARAGGMLAWVMHTDPRFYEDMGSVDFWTGLYQLDHKSAGLMEDGKKSYWVYTCPVAGKRGPAWNDTKTKPPDIPWKKHEPNEASKAAAIMTAGGQLEDKVVSAVTKFYVCQAVLQQPTTPEQAITPQQGLGQTTTGGSGTTIAIVLGVLFVVVAVGIGIVVYVRHKKNKGKEERPLAIARQQQPSMPAPRLPTAGQPDTNSYFVTSEGGDSKSTGPGGKHQDTDYNIPSIVTYEKPETNLTTPGTSTNA